MSGVDIITPDLRQDGRRMTVEGRYIHESKAQEFVDDGWDVTPLWTTLWPYCLATRISAGPRGSDTGDETQGSAQ
jgi:hypothetical protein